VKRRQRRRSESARIKLEKNVRLARRKPRRRRGRRRRRRNDY